MTSGWYSGLHTLFFSRQGGGDVSDISEMKIDQAANERGIDLTPSVVYVESGSSESRGFRKSLGERPVQRLKA